MFENLSDKLQRSFKTLRGQGTISDENISDALREIRLALLESDVNLAVVTELIERIRTRAIGEKVATALSPSEQIVKIVHDELVNVLGRDTARFRHPDVWPARLCQNHYWLQAGPMAKKSRPPPHARLGRRLPPRRPRATKNRSNVHLRPALRRQDHRFRKLKARHRSRPPPRARSAPRSRQLRLRHAHRRHRRPQPHRRRAHGRNGAT